MTANLARSYSSAPFADNVTPFPIRKRLAHAEEAGAPTRADRLTVIAALAVFAGLFALAAWWLRSEELETLVRSVRRRLARS